MTIVFCVVAPPPGGCHKFVQATKRIPCKRMSSVGLESVNVIFIHNIYSNNNDNFCLWFVIAKLISRMNLTRGTPRQSSSSSSIKQYIVDYPL